MKRANSKQCINNNPLIDIVQFIWRSLIKFSDCVLILKWLASRHFIFWIQRERERERELAFIVSCIKEPNEILFCSCTLQQKI